MDKATRSASETQQATKACPQCCELINVAAKKCKHCGSSLITPPFWQTSIAKSVTYIGLFTAALSAFYAVREGYFYVLKQQQARQETKTYLHTADKFIAMDALDYAKRALSKALELSPNDVNLQRKLFFIQADSVLQEIDWQPLNNAQKSAISSLVMEGFRLLQNSHFESQTANIQVMLARLLPHDPNWNDDEAITDLFEKAYAYDSNNNATRFHFGVWLVETELDKTRGLKLITQAANAEQSNAQYWYNLGRFSADSEHFEEALNAYQTAIELLPKQRNIQRIRAANFAKTKLRQLFVETHRLFDLNSDNFLGLNEQQKVRLVELVSGLQNNDRNFSAIAAQFYFNRGEFQKTIEYVGKLLSDYELKKPVASYSVNYYQLYLAALVELKQQPELQQQIRNKLEDYYESLTYEESLEWGIVGEHRYKIGLKVAKLEDKESTEVGLNVLTAFSGYPFATAGVKAGDRIITVAHREVNTLKSLHLIISGFTPDTAIPVTIVRNNNTIELQLIIE